MTAEFAVAMPAVVLVLAACIWGLRLAADQVELEDSVALAARALARGDPSPVPVESWREGSLLCAQVSRTVSGPGLLPPITLSADSCALADGR